MNRNGPTGYQVKYADEDEVYDDRLYVSRRPSSTRRYRQAEVQPAAPRTVVRVTRHEGVPPPLVARASRIQATTQPDPPAPPQSIQRRGFRPHWLLVCGLALCVVVGGWILLY